MGLCVGVAGIDCSFMRVVTRLIFSGGGRSIFKGEVYSCNCAGFCFEGRVNEGSFAHALWPRGERFFFTAVCLAALNYDLTRATALLGWLVGWLSISKGGGLLFICVDCGFQGWVHEGLSAFVL